ncbi:sugar phosphate isomerase/epimerase [Bombilactobacillus bombi]|uniref:Xylose isomerase-like TIM barrel domain-containing protein n=1 Tax=Bombilactobacillus bombi TaxID=1303590 RepID=A0A347SU01_9LACO|nr:TIM barrel protein [Bombilactobacillus bombi]AXX65510.1 sugar phosphate isomerase/epimerase [Bombilactobacillus bombi]RHW44748.1 hypothetical protein DS832_08835 [Bombilactobacillus bombi]
MKWGGSVSKTFIINTAAFKTPDCQSLNQLSKISEAKQLGYSAIEIRNELLTGDNQELIAIATKAKELNIEVYFSVGDVLFSNNELNPKLSRYIEQMHLLDSRNLKINLGIFDSTNQNNLVEQLSQIIDNSYSIYIENNQTPIESDLQQTIEFFRIIPKTFNISYCFDIANWEWLNTNVYNAAKELAPVTRYVHLKNISDKNGKKEVTSLSQGILDWQRLIQILNMTDKFGFEYYAEPDILKSDLALVKHSLL